jgi:ribonuclease P protein component
MRKEERLTKNSQFALVYSNGKSQANRLLALKVLPNGLDVTRFGFSVSKRLGNAVARNKVKRRLRQLVGLTPTSKGWDLVFVARQPASTASYQQLSEALAALLKKGRLLEG